MDNEYIVSEETKKLWSVQLDLLEQFKSVCKKYGLRYYAAGGTLIGAARHNGFVPWDDDLDVQMMWDDYKKLMEIAPDEFKYPYFLQSYENDVYSEVSNNRLRRSDTTGITKWEFDNIKSKDHNRGIFIDIFPLFPAPSSEAEIAERKAYIMQLWRAIRGWNAVQNLNGGYSTVYEEYIDDFRKLNEKYTIEQIKSMYIEACYDVPGDSDIIAETSFKTYNEKFMWKKEWFADTIELPFENTTISCPAMYDEVLKQQFGDWRTPVFNGALHEMYCMDTETPFSEKSGLF